MYETIYTFLCLLLSIFALPILREPGRLILVLGQGNQGSKVIHQFVPLSWLLYSLVDVQRGNEFDLFCGWS